MVGEAASQLYADARAQKRWGATYATAKLNYASTTFSPNDLGYLDSPDHLELHAEVGRVWDRTFGGLRNWTAFAGITTARDHVGKTFYQNLDTKLATELTNDWSLYLRLGSGLPADDDRELRTFDDPVRKYLHHGFEPYVAAGLTTARQDAWSIALDVSAQHFAGGLTSEIALTQTIHPSSQLELQLTTDYVDAAGEQRWLETQGDTPIVGLRRLRQLSQIVRASYAFTPQLTLGAYSQLLLASWNYRDLQSYVDDDTLAPGAMSPTTSFTDHEWNLNAVLRWELRPGSTLFAVYTHSAFNADVFHPDASLSRHALPALWHAPADDVFQVKLSWMFR